MKNTGQETRPNQNWLGRLEAQLLWVGEHEVESEAAKPWIQD